jgi:hypothetical protein
MAHYTERRLNCKDTEKFLLSKGFTLQKDCVHSKWTTFNFMLELNVDDVILSDDQLYSKIASNSYYKGEAMGKKLALESIQQTLSNIVFPPQPYKEPTYA